MALSLSICLKFPAAIVVIRLSFVWLDESTSKYKVRMKPLGILEKGESVVQVRHQYVIFLLGIINARQSA